MDKIILALPSKGRLKEQCEEWLKKRGLLLKQSGDRAYSAYIDGNDDIEIRLLSSSEIAKNLLAGEIHAGITGEDLIREQAANSYDLVDLSAKLGFGRADVVIGVPDGWIDVENMADLNEVAQEMRKFHGRRLRIATKFTRLTTGFFAQHNIRDYRIIYSGGATEGAPLNGVAEAIVDITSTGSTLIANNLKMLEDGLILSSQACLFVSKVLPLNKSQLQTLAQIIG
jgi:ATP phosphoribosyltransferase